jgi:hypothetical protein
MPINDLDVTIAAVPQLDKWQRGGLWFHVRSISTH